MWTGTRGGENYCGNLLWQSGLTLLFPESGQTRLEVCAERFIDQLVEQIESDEGLTRQYMEYLRARDIKVQVEERHVPRDVVVRGIRSHADMLRVAGYAPKWLEEFK